MTQQGLEIGVHEGHLATNDHRPLSELVPRDRVDVVVPGRVERALVVRRSRPHAGGAPRQIGGGAVEAVEGPRAGRRDLVGLAESLELVPLGQLAPDGDEVDVTPGEELAPADRAVQQQSGEPSGQS